MGRQLATSAVKAAVLAALNVASVRTLCPGGVYRGVPTAQAPPFLVIGRTRETPWNAGGTHYGSEVSVQVRVDTSGVDPDGDKRATTILSEVMDLLEVRSDLTVTGWTVCDIWWMDTETDQVQYEDGRIAYVGTATFVVQVRAA